MISEEQNQRLTETGPGTPMGNLLVATGIHSGRLQSWSETLSSRCACWEKTSPCSAPSGANTD